MSGLLDTPVAASRLTVPPGDPAAVRALVAALRSARDEVGDAAGTLDALPHAWQVPWQGVAATAAQEAVHGLALAVRTVVHPLDVAAAALDRWATALEDARVEIGRLQRHADDLAADASRRRTALVREIEAAQAVPVTPQPMLGGGPGQAETLRMRLDVLDVEAAGDQHDVRRRAGAVTARLDDLALDVRRTLEQTRPPVYRGHRESFSDWRQRAISEALSQVPGLAEHPETVAAAVWAFMTAPQLGTVGVSVFSKAKQLYAVRFVTGSTFTARSMPLGLRAAARLPWLEPFLGKGAIGESLLIGNAASRSMPLWTAASRGWEAASLETGMLARGSTLVQGVGVLRATGVVGGVVSTGVSLANVVAQGNPVDAFKENGAGYVADLAEVGFNASSTAFLLAPNPVTAGAVVVTGVVWAGAELVDHWDDVTQLASDGLDTVADAADAAVDVAQAAGDAAVTGAKKVGGWLNPFD